MKLPSISTNHVPKMPKKIDYHMIDIKNKIQRDRSRQAMQHINKHYTDAGLKAFSKTISPTNGVHKLTTDASISFLVEEDNDLADLHLKISKEKILEYKHRNSKKYFNHNFDTRTNLHVNPNDNSSKSPSNSKIKFARTKSKNPKSMQVSGDLKQTTSPFNFDRASSRHILHQDLIEK